MSSLLKIKIARHDEFVPICAIQAVGDLDNSTYEEFQSQVLQEIKAGMRYVLLDFSQVRFISSAGVRAVFKIAKTLSAKNENPASKNSQKEGFKSPFLKIVSPSPNVLSALQVMGLHMSLEIYGDRNEALASFSTEPELDHRLEGASMKTTFTLSEEKKQTLRTSSSEVEAQRLEILRGKRILFVMGSYKGKRHLYEHARKLGVNMVVMDGPGHWTGKAVKDGLFEKFIEVDLLPTETLPERAFAAIKATGLQFDGIATFEDHGGPLVALLANVLGFKGPSLLSIGFSKNKIFTREVCIEAGIPSPRFFRIKSVADLDIASAHVGFPSVLKPISGVSSISTYLVHSIEELHQRYSQTLADAEGHLNKSGVHSDNDEEIIWAKGFDMTLEEYLNGEEFDVDVLLSEGKRVYASVIRDLTQPTHLKEAGSQMPPDFPLDHQNEMIEFAERVLQALEFTNGAFHVEMKYTSNGPRLIEVNARIGGGPVYYFHRQVWGVDLVEQYLLTCLDVPIRPQKALQPLTCLITSDLPSPISGVVNNVDFLNSIADHPQILHAKVAVEVGQNIVGSDKGVPDWLGEIMLQGATVEEASQTMDALLAQIQFPITQNEG
ncbi:MAG: ATP-grasp domain-containing protein [Chloroflexota bacterium]